MDELDGLVTKYIKDGGSRRSPHTDATLKAIKKYCKASPDAGVRLAFHLLLDKLRLPNSASRLFAIELVDALFLRSHVFRTSLLAELPVFLQLASGVGGRPLPEPKDYAKKCRAECFRKLKNWHTKFGFGYKELEIGFHYVTTKFAVEFAACNEDQETEQQRRLEAARRDAYRKCLEDIAAREADIMEHIGKLNECLEILIPSPDREDEFAGGGGDSNRFLDVSDYGLGTRSYKLVVSVPTSASGLVQETAENSSVFEALRESLKVLSAYRTERLPKWIDTIIKVTPDDRRSHEATLKKVVDMKRAAEELIKKAEEIANPRVPDGMVEDDDSDEETFEEVSAAPPPTDPIAPKDKGRLPPPASVVSKISSFSGEKAVFDSLGLVPNSRSDPQRSSKGKEHAGAEPSLTGKGEAPTTRQVLEPTSSLSDLVAVAPEVDYGEDLYYWDKKNIQFNQNGLEYHHRWMGLGIGDNEVPEETLAELRTRAVFYKPKPILDIPECRAPLKNGKLCGRRDLKVCPMHGPVIPRDPTGVPLDPKMRRQEEEEEPIPIWKQLEDDVRANVGLAPVGSKKRKERSFVEEELALARARKSTSTTRIKNRMAKYKDQRNESEAHEFNVKLSERKAFSFS